MFWLAALGCGVHLYSFERLKPAFFKVATDVALGCLHSTHAGDLGHGNLLGRARASFLCLRDEVRERQEGMHGCCDVAFCAREEPAPALDL
jgi:hypothetical protein